MDKSDRKQVSTSESLFNQNTPLKSFIKMFAYGLTQLEAHCSSIYSSRTSQNPFLMQTAKSFIKNGGSDPLDIIRIYKNEGDQARAIPRHWHYIGFGLSDIYNYNYYYTLDEIIRAHHPLLAADTRPLPQIYPRLGSSSEGLSGFGFELTFRVKCNSDEAWVKEPPKWPGLVMQALAKYVFQSKNVFSAGDHVSWHCSLDGEENSRIEHLLMTIDPELKTAQTVSGKVRFIQIVGVCQEELHAAREWNVKGILSMMREREEFGREFLITDMGRKASIFELNAIYSEVFHTGIKEMGSDMTLVSVKHKYSSSKPDWFKDVESARSSEYKVNQTQNNGSKDDAIAVNAGQKLLPKKSRSETNIATSTIATIVTTTTFVGVERGNFLTMNKFKCNPSNQISATSQQLAATDNQLVARCGSRLSYESVSALKIENAEKVNTRYYDNVYLLLSYESAKILPVILEGRLAHKRPFTYQSLRGDLCTTFVPEGSELLIESLVTKERPRAKRGIWLQIYVPDELRRQMLDSLLADFDNEKENGQPMRLPKNYSWPEHKLHITVVEEVL